jgi:hypothetical protein
LARNAILVSAVMAAFAAATIQTADAAEKASWVTVEAKAETLTGADPDGIWSAEEIGRTYPGEGNVYAGKTQVPAGTVWVSTLLEAGCNAECPTRVALRRPGQPDVLLYDDYARGGGSASQARYAPMEYQVRSDLSELKTAEPKPLKLDRNGLK